ncbi:hypothetical protein [Oxynema sp. CENA135]|nr:hypothetical protein [Oxynema sp. CENA135]
MSCFPDGFGDSNQTEMVIRSRSGGDRDLSSQAIVSSHWCDRDR